MTAVSVARQCGLVPADDKLVFVNAYVPDDGGPARIDWECRDETTHSVEATSIGHSSPTDMMVRYSVSFYRFVVIAFES